MNKTECRFCVVLAGVVLLAGSLEIRGRERDDFSDFRELDIAEILNRTVTTAGKKAERVADIPASIVVVTRRDIATYGYQSLAEILENIPGLYLSDDYLEKNFGVRGYWSQRGNRNLKILVNNLPQPDDAFSDNRLEILKIPVEAIDRIEVVRGPLSVMYGSGAFFGVINIFTNEPDEEKPLNIIGLSGGTSETFRIPLRLSGKNADFTYALTASYLTTRGPDHRYDQMITNPAKFIGVTPDQTTRGQLDDQNTYFNFSGSFKNLSLEAAYSEDRAGLIILLPTPGYFPMKTRATRLALGYRRELGKKVTLEARLAFFNFLGDLDIEWFYPGFFGLEHDESTSFKAEALLLYTPTPRFSLTAGLEYYHTVDAQLGDDIPFYQGFENTYWKLDRGEAIITRSLFAQADWKITRKMTAVAGVRLEQTPAFTFIRTLGSVSGQITTRAEYARTGIGAIPRLALLYAPSDRHVVKLMFGRAINRPALIQNIDLLFNPAMAPLQPETIETIELNYLGQFGNFSLGCNLFHNNLDQLIQRTLRVEGDQVFRLQANVGKLSTYGLEWTVSASPLAGFRTEASFTWQKTRDRLPGLENSKTGNSPEFLGYIKAGVALDRHISLAATGTYVGPMETYFDPTAGSAGARLGDPVPGYFQTGLNLRITDLPWPGLFFNLHVTNLFNATIYYPVNANSSWADRGTLGPGRSVLATLGMQF